MITKSKNIFENKSNNQIDLVGEDEKLDDELLSNTSDWIFEEKLSKEFEAVGFFISDHPLNQYKEIKLIKYLKTSTFSVLVFLSE